MSDDVKDLGHSSAVKQCLKKNTILLYIWYALIYWEIYTYIVEKYQSRFLAAWSTTLTWKSSSMEREDKCRSFRHSSSTLRAEGLARQGGKAPIHRENIEGSEVQHHYGDKGCQLPYLEVSLLSIQNLIRQMLGVAESFTPWVNSCHRSVSWFEVSLTPGLGQAKLAYVGSCTTVKMPMKDGMRDKTLTVQDPRSPQRRAISLDHCGTFKNLQSMHGLFSAHRYGCLCQQKGQ